MTLYDSLTIQVRRIVLRIFVGFVWIRLESHEYFQEFTTIYKNLLGNAARTLGRISVESVKNTPNPVRIKLIRDFS